MSGRKPPFEFVARERWLARNGEIARDGFRFRVEFRRAAGKATIRYFYDFTNHILRDLLLKFFIHRIEELYGGTINHRLHVARNLGDFMSERRHADLTPEIFREFIGWCSEHKPKCWEGTWSEMVVSRHALEFIQLYRFGVESGFHNWNRRNLDLMLLTTKKIQRGSQKRAATRAMDQAISHTTFAILARTVALEFEQCVSVFEDFIAGRRSGLYNLEAKGLKRIDPNPFVAFALQAVLRLGIRASELNSLTQQDIHINHDSGRHEVYLHASNKEDAFIPVDEVFLKSLKLCQAWSQEARKIVGEAGAKNLSKALFVYPCTGWEFHTQRPLAEITTYSLNHIHLPYFFKKWFHIREIGNDGKEHPVLHAEGDESRPFHIAIQKVRNAFAVQFAEKERNRILTSRVLRHRNISTTERYYLHSSRLDHLKVVHAALKTEASFLALGLRNPIGVGVSTETIDRAAEAGALTPHGICNEAMEGKSCVRASDCIECPHLVVIASRRPRFVSDRDTYWNKAVVLEHSGDLRGAENARKRALMCEAHIRHYRG